MTRQLDNPKSASRRLPSPAWSVALFLVQEKDALPAEHLCQLSITAVSHSVFYLTRVWSIISSLERKKTSCQKSLRIIPQCSVGRTYLWHKDKCQSKSLWYLINKSLEYWSSRYREMCTKWPDFVTYPSWMCWLPHWTHVNKSCYPSTREKWFTDTSSNIYQV